MNICIEGSFEDVFSKFTLRVKYTNTPITIQAKMMNIIFNVLLGHSEHEKLPVLLYPFAQFEHKGPV